MALRLGGTLGSYPLAAFALRVNGSGARCEHGSVHVAVAPGVDLHEVELMRLIAEGDHGEPVAALYDAYAGGLLRFGQRLLGDAGRAEELVQETFVRLWRGAASYDPAKASVRGFAFMLARRVAIDMIRRDAARPRSTGDALPEVADPAEELAERVARDFAVRDAVAALAPKHREVIELAFDHDLPARRVADQLGVPVGTVRSRVHFALRALRGNLEERGIDG